MNPIRERLESELTQTLDRIRQMRTGFGCEESSAIMGADSTLDDLFDAVRLSADREMSFASRSLLVEKAHRLTRALDCVARGEYGVCRECGELIPPKRLRVIPEVTTCVRCQEGFEHSTAAAGTRRDVERRRPR